MAPHPPAIHNFIESLPSAAYLLKPSGFVVFSNDPFWLEQGKECDCLQRFFSPTQINAILAFAAEDDGQKPHKETLYSVKLKEEISLVKRTLEITDHGKVLFLYLINQPMSREGLGSLGRHYEPGKERLSSQTVQDSELELQSQLMASLVHDMKTPMNAIMGFAELLLYDDLTAEQRANSEMIYKSSNFMLSLINDLLSLARFSQEGIDIDAVPFSLERLMKNVHSVATILLTRQDSDVSLHMETLGDCCLYAMGDPVRLQQVLNNLVNNAIKFTERGSITLGVRQVPSPEGSHALLEFFVQDTGIGIPVEAQKTVFEPYKQADAMISARYGGSGLGLAISKKIVELMGGSISLESQIGRNSGTTVKVRLPFVPAEGADDDNLEVIETQGAGRIEYRQRNKTIMVVEDNIMNQTLAKRVLEKAGYRVVLANEGREALNLYNTREDIALVLMDRHMPVLDGLEASRIIRDLESISAKEHLPIVMLTGSDDKQERDEILDEYVDHYIKKPFKAGDLLKVIESLL